MEPSADSSGLWRLYDAEVPHSRFCDPVHGVSPAEKLSLEHLQLLKHAFDCPAAECETQEGGLRGRSRGEGGGMRFEQFQEVLRSVVGPNVEDAWVERFFQEVDVGCSGRITWQQLCSFLLLEFSERQRASVPIAAVLDAPPQITHCPHNKREPTVCLAAVPFPPPLRYVSVSKGGQITVWSGGLHILKTFRLAGDPAEEVASTRRFRGWTTAAVYMDSVHRVAVATDCRDLHFLNVSSAHVFEDVHLFGFSSIPTALSFWHDAQRPGEPPLLLLGDDKGGVHLMWLLSRSSGLFKPSSGKDGSPVRMFLPELDEHSSRVSYRHVPSVHQSPVTRVMFDAGVVMTSAESQAASVVFMNLSGRQKPHIWRVEQGARCFDYSASLQLMVTGGCDRAVRLWARYVTSGPVATLRGHRATVLDVAVYRPAGQILSYSRDAELKVWDISTHRCLKTLRLPFPCLQPGHIPEHGGFPFLLLRPPLPQETQPHLLVACKDYLAVLQLSETRRGCGGFLTDAETASGSGGSGVAALTCALYNPTLKEVAAGRADSSVSLWDVTTGRRRLHILNAHGEAELTCMTLDSSHRRLITGARNGTIKVQRQNFENLVNLSSVCGNKGKHLLVALQPGVELIEWTEPAQAGACSRLGGQRLDLCAWQQGAGGGVEPAHRPVRRYSGQGLEGEGGHVLEVPRRPQSGRVGGVSLSGSGRRCYGELRRRDSGLEAGRPGTTAPPAETERGAGGPARGRPPVPPAPGRVQTAETRRRPGVVAGRLALLLERHRRRPLLR